MKVNAIEQAKFESLRIIKELESSQSLIRIIYKGKCMSPSLRDEDLLLIQPCAMENVRLGDIVVYRSKKGIRVHRFILRKKTCLIASPDNTCREPEECFKEDFIGKVLFVKRDGRLVDFSSLSVRILWTYYGARGRGIYRIYKSSNDIVGHLRSCIVRLTRQS